MVKKNGNKLETLEKVMVLAAVIGVCNIIFGIVYSILQ
jgi:hypothetical protein